MRLTPNDAQDFQEALFTRALALIGPKRRDYSGTNDPFANFRSAETVGVEPWRGALVRKLDKVQRIRQLAEMGGVGEVKTESLIDTAADDLNYGAIVTMLVVESLPDDRARAMFREVTGREPGDHEPSVEYR